MTETRYLTKSRFQLGMECPTKLYYTNKPEYPDKKVQDTFLQALAQGGFQVGALARCYFPEGLHIEENDHEKAVQITGKHLEQDSITLFEPAFRYKNLYIRADILVKKGNRLNLYEVKAKSFNSVTDSLTNNKGQLTAWKPYVCDAAFQKYVIQNACPDYSISAYLMLADKSRLATKNGLNQKFLIKRISGNRTAVYITGNVSQEDFGEEILCRVNIDDLYDQLLRDQPLYDDDPRTFQQWIHHFADQYQQDRLIPASIGSRCGKCQFHASDEERSRGLKSGYRECWKRTANFSESDFQKPHILSLWDFRKKDQYIAQQKYFLSQIDRSDLEPKKITPHTQPGLSRIDRQEMQISQSRQENPKIHFDSDGLRDVFEQLTYPLHFIDFETSAVAIPFSSGRRPYEQIAFQFSHHVVHATGEIIHQGQWLDPGQGQFPNFKFVRQLKAQLDQDDGSIFRYSNHENTILNAIHRQLKRSAEPDANQLCDWIETITRSSGDSITQWQGPRNMVDLWDWVKKYYYASETNGSNSIKDILPAILNNSDYLKAKYSKPIYGSTQYSLNFKDHAWIKTDEHQRIVSPYKQLPPIFQGIDQDLLDDLILDEDSELADGGAAMIAYAQMQFSEMQEQERIRIRRSLLQYCELDTLAMVMIWEDWHHRLYSGSKVL